MPYLYRKWRSGPLPCSRSVHEQGGSLNARGAVPHLLFPW
jgi:hypothetical protein